MPVAPAIPDHLITVLAPMHEWSILVDTKQEKPRQGVHILKGYR